MYFHLIWNIPHLHVTTGGRHPGPTHGLLSPWVGQTHYWWVKYPRKNHSFHLRQSLTAHSEESQMPCEVPKAWSKCSGTEGCLQSTAASDPVGHPVGQLARNWLLPTTTWISLEVDLALVKPSYGLPTAWIQPLQKPWARGTHSPTLRNWERINVRIFKPRNL